MYLVPITTCMYVPIVLIVCLSLQDSQIPSLLLEETRGIYAVSYITYVLHLSGTDEDTLSNVSRVH